MHPNSITLCRRPPSSEFQVAGQSEAAPDPRKGDGQVPAPHAAPKHTHRHVRTRPRTHTHTHARVSQLRACPWRPAGAQLSPWCSQNTCQHPPADGPSPACEANAGTMHGPAQRGGRRSLQGAEAEAQACGRCGRRGCCSRCGPVWLGWPGRHGAPEPPFPL